MGSMAYVMIPFLLAVPIQGLFAPIYMVVREVHTGLIRSTYTTGYDSCVECEGKPRRN
jgi:hypothetical protein